MGTLPLFGLILSIWYVLHTRIRMLEDRLEQLEPKQPEQTTPAPPVWP